MTVKKYTFQMDMLINILLFLLWLPCCLCEQWPDSVITTMRGHYPHFYCRVTNTVLDTKQRVFRYKQSADSTKTFENMCSVASHVWTGTSEGRQDLKDCSEIYDVGYAFLIYFYYTNSNYFHLHNDMMIPLYSVLRKQTQNKSIVLMPSVESSRLKEIYWETAAFEDPAKYWSQMLEVIRDGHDLRPLDQHLSAKSGNICFRELNFGTPRFSLDDKELMLDYIRFIKSKLGVKHERPNHIKVGLIKRSGRRKILNEEELVAAGKSLADLELVEFAGLSFQQQVAKTQEYSVLVGMNGAGLMNALFLPPGAVAVQLVPYEAILNFKEFSRLLKNRGPYLEWHNEHEDMTVEMPNDKYHGQSDTKVKVDEFVDLIQKALQLVNSDQKTEKSEL